MLKLTDLNETLQNQINQIEAQKAQYRQVWSEADSRKSKSKTASSGKNSVSKTGDFTPSTQYNETPTLKKF